MSYKKIPPFKWFVLQNFPFIEADFDAITNYELLCKVIEYLNKTIVATNDLGKQVEDLNNWFNNLDVQDEVNNKLDEMAESGQLTELITEYLALKSIIAFNNVAEMKVATNLVDGTFCKTYGKITYNDGLGEFYKIRTVTNDDVIDEINIIAITNNNTLVAELINNKKVNDMYDVYSNKKYMIVLGDSWVTANKWQKVVANELNVNYKNYGVSGTGWFVGTNISTQADNAIADTSINKNLVNYIVIYCGSNDFSHNYLTAENYVDTISETTTKLLANFPNAKIHLFFNNRYVYGSTTYNYLNSQIELYKNITNNILTNNLKIIPHLDSICWISKQYFQSDLVHPTDTGYTWIGKYIALSLVGGNVDYYHTNSTSVELTNENIGNGWLYFYYTPYKIMVEVYFSVETASTTTRGVATVNRLPVELFTNSTDNSSNNGLSISLGNCNGQGDARASLQFNRSSADRVYIVPKSPNVEIPTGKYFGSTEFRTF